MESAIETVLPEGFSPVRMGKDKERQRRCTTQRLPHTKVIRLMTVNNDPMECALQS